MQNQIYIYRVFSVMIRMTFRTLLTFKKNDNLKKNIKRWIFICFIQATTCNKKIFKKFYFYKNINRKFFKWHYTIFFHNIVEVLKMNLNYYRNVIFIVVLLILLHILLNTCICLCLVRDYKYCITNNTINFILSINKINKRHFSIFR